jgi:hypothetical protein
MPVLEERIEKTEDKMVMLQDLMDKLAYQTLRTSNAVENLSKEMREFKDESEKDRKTLHQEMKDFKEEMREFKDESERDRKKFDEDMRKFKEEAREEDRKMNKKWGEISNKMGTIVEDIIAPAVRPAVNKYFNCDPYDMSIRRKIRRDNLEDEFDVIAVCEDKVFLVEVKSTPKANYVLEFKDKIERFKKLFPEFEHKKVIPIFASLMIPENIVNLCTKQNYYALAYREWDYMDILNFDKLSI